MGVIKLPPPHSDYLLVDPSLEEEKVLSGHLSVVMNTHKEICTMQLEGGVALDRTEVILSVIILC